MKKLSVYLYRIILGLKAIGLYKNWARALLAYLHLNKRTKTLHLRNNTLYRFRRDTMDFQVVNEIYMNKIYHRYLNRLKHNSIVIDIGANIGVFSVLAAKQNSRVKVYSYEPFEENFLMLKENIALNHLENQIKPFKLGIGGKKGARTLHLDEANTGGHSMYSGGSREVKINLVTLTDVFRQNKIKECDFLKVDCEGAEYEIFYSTSPSVLKKIKTISLEFHEEHGAGKAVELAKFLWKHGFKVHVVGRGLGFIYAEKKQ
ncbi:MAG: FkbM family methyltransferase [archaeon]|jgi:FkbM family methyltransferase|nr:FkbM family methyltransferase [archaeon]